MVHRAADSRLLTNLLTHEKDYAKHLVALLDSSHSSLASFSAYASAASPPLSNVILSVAGGMAGADAALRRYAAAVDEWRDLMKALKSLEDEVGNIMRDREILVTRLIKASKSQKPPNRDSMLLAPNHRYSSSSLSLSGAPESPSLGSSKMTAAQAELQACEAHLASKERELEARRNSTIRDGLSLRCRAMVECGWVWGEMGKEALKTLETLGGYQVNGASGDKNLPYNSDYIKPQHTSTQSIFSGSGVVTSIRGNSNPDADNKPLPDVDSTRPSSDLSSIAPSQSASQVNLVPVSQIGLSPASLVNIVPAPQPIPASIDGMVAKADIGNSQSFQGINSTSYLYSATNNRHVPGSAQSSAHGHEGSGLVSAPAQSQSHSQIQIPPAHAILDASIPVSTSLQSSAGPSRHVLARRITEEELKRQSMGDSNEPAGMRHPQANRSNEAMAIPDADGSSSSENDAEEVEEGKLSIIENPRFSSKPNVTETTAQTQNTPIAKPQHPPQHHHQQQQQHDQRQNSSVLVRGRDGEKGGDGAKQGFFGSIKNLFGRHSKDKDKEGRAREGSIDDEQSHSHSGSPSKTALGGLFARRGDTKTGGDSRIKDKETGKWETRTDRNLRLLARDKGSDDEDGLVRVPRREPVFSPVIMPDVFGLPMDSSSPGVGVIGAKRSGWKGRKRVASDIGVNTNVGRGSEQEGVTSATPAAGESSPVVGGGRRLKKPPRQGRPTTRSSSVPPRESGALGIQEGINDSKDVIVRPGEGDNKAHKKQQQTKSKRNESVQKADKWVDGLSSVELERPRDSDDVGGRVAAGVSGKKDKDKGKPSQLATMFTTQSSPSPKQAVAVPFTSAKTDTPSPGKTADAVAAAIQSSKPVDPPLPSPSTNQGVARKKSFTKVTKRTSVPPQTSATVLAAGGDKPSGTFAGGPGASGGLSRNSSILSAVSAPPGVAKDKALGQGMGVASIGRRTSLGSSQKAVRTIGQQQTGQGATTPYVQGHRRSTSVDLTPRKTGAGTVHVPGGGGSVSHIESHTSLMSIVEDVTRGNRAGWSQGQDGRSKSMKSVGGSQKHVANMDISSVRAPPRVDRQMLLGSMTDKPKYPPALLSGSRLELPKAPGSVVDLLRATGGVVSGSGSEPDSGFKRGRRGENENEARRSGTNRVPSSASAPDLTRPSEQEDRTPKASSRPAKSPLRSALRNPSRTPSPLPGTPTRPLQKMYVPSAPSAITTHAPIGILGTPLHSPSPVQAHPVPNSAPHIETDSNALKIGGESTSRDADDDDDVSISSYETVHESPYNESPSSPLPQSSTNGPTTTSSSPQNPPPPVGPQVRDYSMQAPNAASQAVPVAVRNMAQGGSDISSSTTSTAGPSQDNSRRRKSVRVSLLPTFSPTPPAIDDDDEDEQETRAPWVWKSGNAPLPSVPSSTMNGDAGSGYRKRNVQTRTQSGSHAPVNDIWEDSSEEDEEYRKAKRMLVRAAKREKNLGA